MTRVAVPRGVYVELAEGYSFAGTLKSWHHFPSMRLALAGTVRAIVNRPADLYVGAVHKDGLLYGKRSGSDQFEFLQAVSSRKEAAEIAKNKMGLKCLML